MQEQPQLKTRKIENRSHFEAQIKIFFEKYIISCMGFVKTTL